MTLDKVFSFVTTNKTINWLIIIVFVLFVISLIDRYIYIDDAWFGEQAYWFSKLGHVRVSTIIDFYGWDERLFVYHKLNIIIGSALITIFEWSPEPLRIFTLIVFLFFLTVTYKSIKNTETIWNQIDSKWVLFFLIVNPLTFLYSYTFRPEILVMSLGFFSFLLLFGKQTCLRILFSGMLAGLAILVHLNGAMFVIAGMSLLLIRKEFKLSVMFALFASIITSLYFYDLWEPGHFDSFLYQIKHWPDDITTNYESDEGVLSLLLTVLVKLSSEHQRFFWSHDVWGLSAMAIFALIAKGKVLWKKYKELLIYLLVGVISLNIFGSHIAEVNMLLLLPFLALIAAAFLTELNQRVSTIIKAIALFIIIVQIVVVVYGFANIFSNREATTNISENILLDFLENKEKVLVPYRFIFNQLPNKNLVSYKTMEYHQVENGQKFTKEEFIELATELDIYYLVISPEMYDKNEGMYPWMIEEFKGINNNQFLRLKIDNDSHILKTIE